MSRARGPLSSAVAEVARELESWRRTRRGGVIPEGVWRKAVGLARRHGVHAVKQALGLDYYSLQRRVAERRPAERSPGGFVEIGPAPCAAEWVIEVEDVRGTKLRVQVRGVATEEIASLARTVLGAGA